MREFFIILGVLAVTALLTVVTVENMINSSVSSSESTPIATTSSPSNTTDEPVSQPNTTLTNNQTNETTSTRTVNAFRLVINSTPYIVNQQSYDAEIGTIEVQEIRGLESSPKVELPVVRIFSTSPSPSTPVFLLADGPGRSNLWQEGLPAWLLSQHDLIIVGYRGMDGSVSLKLPEVVQTLQSMQVDPLSTVGLSQLGDAIRQGFSRLQQSGIAVDHYTLADVVGDLDNVRMALNYEKINFYADGYGTRIAYLYELEHPQHVNRSLMLSASAPGGLVTSPKELDTVFQNYAQRWQQEGQNSSLLQLIQGGLSQLPQTWKGLRIDADKVKMGTLLQLASVNTAPQVFNAYQLAAQGDYAGLAWLSSFYNQYIQAINWGDFYAKGGSADADFGRNYIAELAAPGSVIGSPLAQLLWGGFQRGGVSIKPLDFEDRTLQLSQAETLMVHGQLDPLLTVGQASELLPYLTNGHLVVLDGMGHSDDLTQLQPNAFQHMARIFFLNGSVDQSRFAPQLLRLN